MPCIFSSIHITQTFIFAEKWVPNGLKQFTNVKMVLDGTPAEKKKVDEWHAKGGVLIMATTRLMALVKLKHNSNKNRKDNARAKYCHTMLINPGCDLLVIDEAHSLKNKKTKLYAQIDSFKTKLRLLITGSPVQNNLMEYFNMIRLCMKTNRLLGSRFRFNQVFVMPITKGQNKDASTREIFGMLLTFLLPWLIKLR